MKNKWGEGAGGGAEDFWGALTWSFLTPETGTMGYEMHMMQ